MGRRWNMRGSALAVVLTAGASLALAAPAMAAKSQQEKFKIEIFAEQHTDWTSSFTNTDDCTGSTSRTDGSGGQSFSLTTKKPVKVTAASNKISGDTFLALYSGKPTNPKIGVPVNVAADQQGSYSTTVIQQGEGEACGDGGGGAPPPQPDCGPRSFKSEVRTTWVEPENYFGDPAPLIPVLVLDGPLDADGNRPLHDQWTNCPGPANDTGGLIETPTGGLPPKKVFGDKKKFKVKAKDTEQFNSSSTQQTTRINWTVEFKRL